MDQFKFQKPMKVLGRHFKADTIVRRDELDAGCLQSMLASQQLVPVQAGEVEVPATAEAPTLAAEPMAATPPAASPRPRRPRNRK